MTTTATPRRPRVKLSQRLVLVHSASLGSFHLYKLNKDGTLAGNFKERITIADTPQEACKKLDITFAGFEAVNGIVGLRFPSAAAQVQAIWKAATTH